MARVFITNTVIIYLKLTKMYRYLALASDKKLYFIIQTQTTPKDFPNQNFRKQHQGVYQELTLKH